MKGAAYDETGKEVKLNQAGIIVDLSNSKGVVSFDGYTLKAIKCGYGTISYTQYVDNEKITVDIPIHVGNASKSVSEWPSSYQYLQSDYEYVSMCLDLVYSIHKANMPTEYADVDMNMGDIMLDSCANVDEYLKWILGIDWNMSVNVMKKSLSEFIIDYSKYINSNELVMKESKSFSQGFMDLINNIDTTMSTFKDVCDVLKIDKGVITRAIQAFQANDEITDVDLKTIVKFVKELKHHQLIEVMPDAGYFLKGLKELGYSWESFALVSKSTYEFLKTDVSNKIAKSIKSVPNYIGFTADLVEMVLYISVDYSESIKILQNLQKLLLPYFGEDSPEIQAISELIFEFEYDWLEGATGLVLDILAGTINTLGSPIVSLATFAANIAAKLGHVSEKRHITVLTLYVCALHKALEAYMKMYTNGQQALTLQDLKFATSLYLNLIYRQNVLAQKIVKTDWEKAEIDIEIKEIERVFVSYLKY